MQGPITKIRIEVEPLETRDVPSAIGFHDAIRPYLGSGRDATTARSIIQDAASAIGPTANVKSKTLSHGRALAALAQDAHAQSESKSSGDPIPLDSKLGMSNNRQIPACLPSIPTV